jgi:hypothetical protein
MLWERFPTAINSVGPTSVIVVKNHSHQALIKPKNNPKSDEVSYEVSAYVPAAEVYPLPIF